MLAALRLGVTSVIVLALAAVPAVATRSGAEAPAYGGPLAVGPLAMVPMTATFIPRLRQTDYNARLSVPTNGEVDITWTLHLELVDPAGTASPGEPGSMAAVDLGCNNAGDGLPSNPSRGGLNDTTYNVAIGRTDTSTFTWHHPDAADSLPPGKYHCNHLDMGPRGHQGLITVVARDRNWECTASYKGTNSTSSDPLASVFARPSAADVARSLKNGTASEPTCSAIRG